MAFKRTNLSLLGGFPFTEDDLEHDLNGVYETLAGIFGDATTPIVLAGTLATSGWIMMNGEILPYAAPGTLPPLSAGYDYFVVVNQIDYPVVFEDTTTHNAIGVTRSATYGAYLVASPPAGSFPLDSFKNWHEVLGAKARGAWTTFWSGSVSAYDGTVQYKKNELTNTLQIKGALNVKAAGISGSAPIYFSIPATALPTDCRPPGYVPFVMHYRYHNSTLKEVNDVDYILQLSAEVTPAGGISLGLIKPISPVTGYSVSFNCIIPLD